MDWSIGEIVLVGIAGVLAGAINAVAGGGSLITFPVLLATGMPALTANISNTIAQCPGYASVAYGYRRQLKGQAPRVRRLLPFALGGGAIGVAALELGSAATFRQIVPALILIACAMLAAGPALRRRIEQREAGHGPPAYVLDVAVVFTGAYISYFGAAAGVLLLAILALLITDTLQRLNALNRFLVLLVNLPTAIALGILGPVDWIAVAVLAPATLLGGSLGVLVARRLSDRVLRITVVTIGVGVAVYLLATG
jgi:uncharacterized protein